MRIEEVDTTRELPIMEYFHTIQGEGYHTGKSAFFIRLAGCDVGCVWCDVKESWDVNEHPLLNLDFLENEIVTSGADFVVITGGEPAMYDLTTLINRLKKHAIYTAIETSGTYNLTGEVDWYCFSPKKFKEPVSEAFEKASELKIVVSHPSDFEWAEKHSLKVSKACKLYLQPEWSKQERFLPMIIDFVKKHTKWKISLQTHKFMNIP